MIHVYYSPLSVPISADYWLIGTDYNTYYSGYACLFGIQLAWIFTRDKYPKRDVVGTVLCSVLNIKLSIMMSAMVILHVHV
jgi:hypothetical protein